MHVCIYVHIRGLLINYFTEANQPNTRLGLDRLLELLAVLVTEAQMTVARSVVDK
jgi:hypothetical protein